MKALCLFGSLRCSPKSMVLRNALRLAARCNCGLYLLIDAYPRSLDRSYLDRLGFKEKLYAHIQQDIEDYLAAMYEEVDAILDEEELDVIFCVECYQDKNWEQRLVEVIQATDTDWLLLDYSSSEKLHPVFKRLTQFPVSVLLMRNKRWKGKPVLLAALDPLHRHDRPAILDRKIADTAQSISVALGTNFKIVHCCNIAPYLLKYAKQIKAVHSDALREFRVLHHLDNDSQFLLTGDPEVLLPNLSLKIGCDILVMGSYCRSSLSKYWLGSTTEAVVRAKPCDIILVRPG